MSSQSSIAIPSSTVVAIGGGFVGLALAVLFTLFMFRVTRLKLEARHRRRAGEQVTFHEIWDRDGGMWGFLTGIGGDSGLVGAGGRPDLTLTRLRNEIRLWEFYKAQNKAEMVRPKMWEVEVEEKGVMRGQEALVLDSSMPLGAMPSKPPENVEYDDAEYDLLEPTLTLSALVLYPSQPSSRIRTADSEDWLDLPEMVVGTMKAIPYITPPLHAASEGDDHEVKASQDETDDRGSENDSSLDQYALPELSMDAGGHARRAGWRKIGKRWAIEGIDDEEPADEPPEPDPEQRPRDRDRDVSTQVFGNMLAS